MARHGVGPYGVEVLHRQDIADQKPDVILIVFEGGQFVEMARFGWREFNSAELRRELPSLARFDVKKLGAVIEDARCWARDGDGKPAKARPKTRRAKRKARHGNREIRVVPGHPPA